MTPRAEALTSSAAVTADHVILGMSFTDPNFLCSYSYWKPGQYTGFSGYEGVRQGNIHFAGEHCSTNFQGFMEGGASERVRAANEILTDLTKA